jgi:hypothetical protein
MKILIALFLVGCSNSSADIVPKIPDMACNQIGVTYKTDLIKCEDKNYFCYLAVNNGTTMQCFKK